MLRMSELQGLKVYKPLPEKKRLKKDGTPRKPSKLGKVRHVVFSPDGRRVVGLLIARPDIAGMVKREDVFLGIDALGTCDEGLMCTMGDESFDDRARRRLKLNWDACILWAGMDAVTQNGKSLGYVTDVTFDAKTGAVDKISISDGGTSQALVGSIDIPASMLRGYSNGNMVVDQQAASIELSGGLAAKAGEASAKAQVQAKEATAKAGAVVGEAVDKGSFALGRALGKAKRAVAEATADTEPEPQVPAEPVPAVDVVVEPPQTSGTLRSGDKPEPVATYSVPKTADKPKAAAAKSKPAAAKPKPKPKTAEQTATQAAKVVGKKLGKTKGMFAAFKQEFDNNSK